MILVLVVAGSVAAPLVETEFDEVVLVEETVLALGDELPQPARITPANTNPSVPHLINMAPLVMPGSLIESGTALFPGNS